MSHRPVADPERLGSDPAPSRLQEPAVQRARGTVKADFILASAIHRLSCCSEMEGTPDKFGAYRLEQRFA
jgi:hypothetical protein